MRSINRAAMLFLAGVAFLLSTATSASANTRTLTGSPPDLAVSFGILALEAGDLPITEHWAGMAPVPSPCFSARPTSGATTEVALNAPLSRKIVLQSDTVTIPPPGIERDLCADALAARAYWCDRASGPDGTPQDMANCLMWDLMASFLCYVGGELGSAAIAPEFPSVITPRWGVGYPVLGYLDGLPTA